MAGDPPRLPWSDAIGYLNDRPLDGYVMAPERPWQHEAASIICGHPLIQERLFHAEQDEFETFVREVLRTVHRS